MSVARWSPKTSLWIIAATVLIAIILRYPLVGHERFQTDSYFINLLSQSIVDNGYARWTFSPLSYFGYYPLSYPTGYPVVISELSLLTGLSVEGAILASTIPLSALFSIVVFCLGRNLLVRTDLALLAMLLATFAPRFVDTTYWNGSARGPEVVLLSMLLLTFMRASSMRSGMMMALSLPIILACFALHHMAILVILFGLAWLITHWTVRRMLRISRKENRSLAIVLVMLILFAGGIISVALSPSLAQSFRSGYQGGLFTLEKELLSVVLNLGASYVHQIGVVLLLVPLAFYLMFTRGTVTQRLFFPLVAILAFVPVLDRSLYVSMLLLPFACISGVFTIGSHLFEDRPRLRVFLVTSIILLSCMVCVTSVNRWNSQTYPTGDGVLVEDQVFSDAQYLGSTYGAVPSTANQVVLITQIGAIGQLAFVGSDMYMSVNGYITADELRDNVSASSLPFPSNIYVWFSYDNPLYADRLVQRLFTAGTLYIESANDYESAFLKDYPSFLVLIDEDWPDEYVALHGLLNAVLPSELRDAESSSGMPIESYKVYSTSGLSSFLWTIASI